MGKSPECVSSIFEALVNYIIGVIVQLPGFRLPFLVTTGSFIPTQLTEVIKIIFAQVSLGMETEKLKRLANCRIKAK